MMKKIIFFGLATLLLINFSVISNFQSKSKSLNLKQVINFSSANAECDWPELFFGTCNQRLESIISNCTREVMRRVYFDTYGNIVGVAVLYGTYWQLTSGYSTGIYEEEETTEVYTATRVNCPTDGSDNDCEEYVPC